MLKLGAFGQLTVQQPRDKARAEKVRVLDGVDRQAERRVEAARLTTVKELMDSWVEEYAKVHRKRWEEDESRTKGHIQPRLGKRTDRWKHSGLHCGGRTVKERCLGRWGEFAGPVPERYYRERATSAERNRRPSRGSGLARSSEPSLFVVASEARQQPAPARPSAVRRLLRRRGRNTCRSLDPAL